MKPPRIWHIVADGGRARIVQKRNGGNAFDTHRELVSAEIHSHTHELGTDRPSRTHESAMSARHAMQPREDLHRAGKRKFVQEVAAALHEQAVQSAVADMQFGYANDLETHFEYRVRTIGNNAASPVNSAGAAKESGYQSMTIRTSSKIICCAHGR